MGAQGSNGGGSTKSDVGAGVATTGAVATASGVGAPIGIGLMAAGGLLSAWGALDSASAQAEQARERAKIDEQQANEILQRESANESIRDQQAYQQKLSFGAAYAGSGKAGTAIGSQLEIERQAQQANIISNREAQFQAQMALEGAKMENQLAGSTQTAGYLNAASSVIGAAGKIAATGAVTPASKPTPLPGTGDRFTGSAPQVTSRTAMTVSNSPQYSIQTNP